MCKHTEHPTYHHVYDEDEAQVVCTYVDAREAHGRRVQHEADTGHLTIVTQNISGDRTVRVGDRWFADGDLIPADH